MEENKTWKCSCGCEDNTGFFCEECGAKRFEYWMCTFCGETKNKGKFCKNCGKDKESARQSKMEEAASETENKKWSCSCGETENMLKFCRNCGSSKTEQRTIQRTALFRMKNWDCVCGKKGNQGMFCDACRKTKERAEKEERERLMEARYQSALRCMRKASTKKDYMETAREFMHLKGYQESDFHYETCMQKVKYLGGNVDASLLPEEVRQMEERKKDLEKEKSLDVIRSYEWGPGKKSVKRKFGRKEFGKKHFIGITSAAVLIVVLIGFALFGFRKEVGTLLGASFAQAKEKYNLKNTMSEDLEMEMCYGSNGGMFVMDGDENGSIDIVGITGKGYEIYGLKTGMTVNALKNKVPDGFVWENLPIDDYDGDGCIYSSVYRQKQIMVKLENGRVKEVLLALAEEGLGI